MDVMARRVVLLTFGAVFPLRIARRWSGSGIFRSLLQRFVFSRWNPCWSPSEILTCPALGWVIVGGESGPGHREMQEGWVLEIRDLCEGEGVPFFFKQWAGFRPKLMGS